MHTRLLCSTSVAALVLGGALTLAPATGLAQQSPAGQSPAKSDQLEEIVVTAEFKKENLQTTPLAISAFTGDNLESRNLDNVKELSAMVPNTVIEQLGPGWGSTISAFIRGVGLGDNSLSFEPGVPIYIDGVYNGRPQAMQMDLLDLSEVQVLRGPQGTLFGKNAIGGAVTMASKKPQGDDSGYAEIGGGSYDLLQGRAALDLGLVPDKLMLRVAISDKYQQGYGDILNYGCVTGQSIPGGTGILGPGGQVLVAPISIPAKKGGDCVVGHEGGVNDQAGRAALRIVPTDNLEINIVGDVTNQHDQGPVSKYLLLDTKPSNSLVALWNETVGIPVFGVPLGNQFLTSGKYSNYETFSDPLTGLQYPDVDNVLHWGVEGTIDYDIPDVMHIKSITAYRQFDNFFGRDSDGSPLPFNRTENDTRHRQTSEELDLSGNLFDNRLEWVAGLYYYDSTDSDRGTTILLPYAPAPISSRAYDVLTTRDLAGFVHTIFHLTDKLSLTEGIRYTRDDKLATINEYSCCNLPGLTGLPLIPGTQVKIGANRWSPQVELSYQWTPDIMTYALYSTGFRGGGFGPRPSDAYQVRSFQPEDLVNYEVGEKSEFFDHHLSFNADFFYEVYTNQQQGFNTIQPLGTPGGGSPWFETVNTGRSDIWGLEGEVQARPITGMLIQASGGYLNYYRTDPGLSGLCQTTQAGVGGALVSGITCYPPRTPKWNWGLGIQQAIQLGDGGDLGTLTPRFDVNYQSAVFFTDNFNIGQPAYYTANARLTWDSPDGLWEAAAYGTNITNTYYYYGKLSLQGVLGFDQANPAPPAEWGITVKRNFNLGAPSPEYTPPPVAPTPVAPPPAPAAPAPEAQRSFQVFFDFDKSNITEAAAAVIRQAADAVKAGNAVSVTVTGHTDTVGSAKYNQALSERRAAAVKGELVKDGVAAGEIATIGVGKTGLLVPTADGVREPQNRRAEIVLK